MPISNDSYEEAWQKLLDRYDNKKQIVQSLIKTFLDQKPISEANCFNLHTFLDTSDKCLRGLNALESRRFCAIKSSEEEFPNMKAFLDFLNGKETSQGEGANAGTRNEASEFKGQAGESQINSGASVNSELNLSFTPTAKRIVWRESKDSPIREYKLCTVTYGTASALYLANRCLFQTGLDLERDDPAVSSFIKESFYIDYLMAAAPSSEEAISLKKTLFSILKARGFHLRKWRSNSSEVLSRISANWVGDSSNLEIHPDGCSKALGLTWNSMKDIFIFNLKHGFCDASELAYASVIYAVQPQADGNTKVTFLVAKSRVAPLKSVLITRLELKGALILARLCATCKNILKEYDVHFYAWTDSQVVLSWLSSHPRNWKPYIANRTSEILDLVPADSWCCVPTKVNPAGIACRGLSPKELPTCVLWWEGPQWLSCEMDSWPKQPKRNDKTSSVSKERKRTAFSFPVAFKCDFIDSLFLKFSSFTKMIDILAFCFRYITNCKARVGKMKNLDSKVCCRYRAATFKQLMGDLPTHRVTPSRPFSDCRVDYAGPINILRYRGRGAKTTMGYIDIFVCFVTIALHLELVSDLTSEAYLLQRIELTQSSCTSEAFIASLKGFCARRGAPKHIYCDNGTTFVWCEVISSSPEHINDDKLSLRFRLDIVQKMKLGFWRKWKIDYLSNLQNRTKLKSSNNNSKVGEIVIIKEDNIPPATWPLGKLIETHPGKDGLVRVVTLRTVKGRFERPIHKLRKLPLHQE
ncbi:integrase catalytic domain-containing protein [Trichonephila clavipes]|uniref:Integrase catalytic domain-containing protein n=1 Tax=Trichonephila clavipes TaxID=2585209 RepID=A0A8X7B8L9_TRICX|nr:integrase catalytic domain-containing protein [Trichonephila clavipes]